MYIPCPMTQSLTFLGPKIWDIVPQVIKNSKSLSVSKTKIKQWLPINCSCRSYRSYLQYVGYIRKFLIFHPEISIKIYNILYLDASKPL